MHIEKREDKGKIKYYLSHSYREGKKVHKFRKYLGMDLLPEKLQERHDIAAKLILEEIHKYTIIHNPLRMDFSTEEIHKVADVAKTIPISISHLSQKEWRLFSEVFTYNTNAIEGSKLNKAEVKGLLEDDKWPDKSKEDIAEAFGVDEAIQFIRTTKETFSLELIRTIHRIVFKNSKRYAGKFRKKGEEVVVLDTHKQVVHEGAPQSRVLHLLKELIDWYQLNKNKHHGLLVAAVVHNQFENIHPFVDGNGRVGRLLLNYILLKHNLPPLSVDFANRFEYYQTLQAYDKNHDLKPTLDLFMKEYKALSKLLKR
jgi:Fic family protein